MPTRHESPAAGSSVLAPGALPPALADRLSDLTPMPMQGGEADLLRVRDSADGGGERVLKIYRPQLAPDAEVWSELTAVRSRHVVRVVATGRLADGRFYELMEYLPEGSMRDLGAGRQAFPARQIVDMVRQLTAGLTTLHERGITHRDLKPENVLVRSVDPVELVLTDFGLSRRLDRSMVFSTDARTSAYAAPEAYSTHVSPARDWWSLGIMVLELVTGVRPFHGLDELMIQMAVTTKPVPVDAITDPRLNRLCSGLLVMDRAKRWGSMEVQSWLAGGAPPVPDRRVPLEVRTFAFGNESYHDPESLAVAMAQQWPAAARRFFVSMGEAWASLKVWLRQFDDPDRYPPDVVERRQELLDDLERSTAVPNAKLLRLLAGLNPAQPPVYRQAHVDAAQLRGVARTALDGNPNDDSTRKANGIVDELWDDRLLQVLAGFAGGEDLRAVDARWQDAVQGWEAARAELGRNPRLAPVLGASDIGAKALAAMLELAAGAPRGPDWARAMHERGQALPAPVDWYGDLLAWVGDDPVRAYAGWCASSAAQAQAEETVRVREAAELTQRMREQAWAEREQRRLDGRASASANAVGGVAIAGLGWLVVGFVATKTELLAVSLFAVVGAQLVAELALARTLGADYHPVYSLRQALAEVAGELGTRMRFSPGAWAAGIIGLLIALAYFGVIVPVLALVAAAVHIIWTLVRHQRWSRVHEQERREAMTR